MFGIKLKLETFPIKLYYSFRLMVSYRDARGEETNAHTHANLISLKAIGHFIGNCLPLTWISTRQRSNNDY